MAVCRAVHESLCIFVCISACLLAFMPVYIYESIITFASINAWNVGPTAWMYISISVCPSLGLFVYYICLSVCLPVCVWLFDSLSVNSFICLFVYICLSFYLHVCTSNSLSTVCILVYQSVRVTVCLTVCLHIYAHLLSRLSACLSVFISVYLSK